MTISLHRFRPRLLDALQGYDRSRFARDLGAGLTVGIVALPLALAFGIASGLKPEQGLITAIVAGFLISALGGSQVQIGGPAGAFIVVVYGIVERHGLGGLLVSTFAAGVLMLLLGLFRLGALIRYIPVGIVIGFTNGIAVLIALSQLRDALGLEVARMPGDFAGQMAALARALPSWQPTVLLLTVAALALLALWPRLARRPGLLGRVALRLPGPMVVMVLATLATWLLALPVPTIGSRFGELPSLLQQGLPTLALPPLSWDSLRQLTIPIVTIALLGAIESLLCARVADSLGEHRRHDPNQELMAQGVANMVSPLLAGMPATGTIARTVTNVRAGATSPVAGMVHAGVLLLVLLVAAPLAAHVPLAALAAVLLFVAWNMFEGHQFLRLRQFSRPYRALVVTSFVLTVAVDLTVAVEVSLVMACLFFVWRMGTLFSVRRLNQDQASPAEVAAFELYGALFFGAVDKIEALAEQLPPPTRAVVLDLQRLVSMDSSGLDALEQLWRTLQRRGITLRLAAVNAQPLSLMRRAGFEDLIGPAQIAPRLDDALAAAAAERAAR